MELIKFEFKCHVIEFEPQTDNVLVNATQMAKIFDKEVSGFLKTDSTKNFIEAYCRTEDIPSQNEFSPNGKLIKVISTGRNNGTWMNRIVALKFAAWLDPYFEVWVYKTIDQILFGQYKRIEENLKESAKRKLQIEKIREDLRNDERYRALVLLELEDKQATYRRGRDNSQQLSFLKELFSETTTIKNNVASV